MIINPNDKYYQYSLLLSKLDEESKNKLRADAEIFYGSPWGLALRDFLALSKGDLTFIGIANKEEEWNASIRQYIWMQSFTEMAMQVANILKKMQIPQDEDEKTAASYCMTSSVNESVLVFTRKYFGLKNFAEAEEISVSDFIIAKKDEYNIAMYKYMLAQIQRNKMKKK